MAALGVTGIALPSYTHEKSAESNRICMLEEGVNDGGEGDRGGELCIMALET